jgi:hypothetical protein
MFLINFFKDAWNKAINPFIGILWHVVGGAVTGSILPTLTQSALSGQITKSSLISTIVSGVIGAIVGYAQHSNNKAVATLANQITPAVEAQVDQKVTDAVNKVAKISILFLVIFTASSAMANPFGIVPADGVEMQGIALNLNLNGPAEYVQTAGNKYVLLPTAGFSLSLGWEDVFVTPNGAGDDTEIQGGLGLTLQGNYGNTVDNTTVTNSVLGLNLNYQGFSAIVGLQIAGESLGGPGSSGVVLGASYSLDSLINFNGLFLKTSK